MLAGAALCAVLGPGAAVAQLVRPELPGSVQPGRDRPEAPTVPEADFDFTIQSPRRAPVPRAVDELTFDLRGIEVSGSSIFPPDRLATTWQPLIGQQVRLSDILGIADRIEAMYRERGYILTRAFVPPQRVSNGIFQISIVEGFVSAVRVEGGGEAARQRVERTLATVVAERPVNSATMERALLLANDLPGMTASGLLRPSADQPGASELFVTLTQQPVSTILSVDNRGSHFNGPWTGSADVAFTDFLGWGEQIVLGLSATPEFQEKLVGQLRYSQPIGSEGLLGSFFVLASHGQPGSTLNAFDVITDSFAAGPRLRYPLLRTRELSVFLEGGFTWQDAKVDVLGARFSSDHWRVVDVAASIQQGRFLAGTTTFSLGLAKGLDILGASPSGSALLSRSEARTDFLKLTSSLRRAQTIDGPLNAVVTAYGQYSFDPLLAGEEVAYGGYAIGRGYDPGAITGDNGIGGSIELRYDLRVDEYAIGGVQPYLFFDTAKVWQNKPTGSPTISVASTGAGIRAGVAQVVDIGLEFARTLNAVPGSNNGQLSSRILVNAAIRF